MSRQRPRINCACCNQPGDHKGRGLISSCYEYHKWRGTLHRYPVRPHGTPWIPPKRKGLTTLARYTELLSEKASVARIRWELSLTERSIQRYEAARKHLAQRLDGEPRERAA